METGGAQKLILEKAKYFSDNGYSVQVVFLYDKEGIHDYWKSIYKFPIHNLFANPYSIVKIFGVIPSIFRFVRFLNNNKFDVLEAFTIHSNVFSIPISWLMGIKVRIATHHGKVENIPDWLNLIHKLILNSILTDTVIAVSESSGNQIRSLLQIPIEKMNIIFNGISITKPKDMVERSKYSEEFSLEENSFVGLAVGRLATPKNFPLLVTSFFLTCASINNIYLLIAGIGEKEGQIKQLILESKYADKILLLGVRTDIKDLMNFADFYISTSDNEGLSIALLEAMSMRMPIIATNVEGVKEILNHRENGLVVEPRDMDGIRDAVITIYNDKELRDELGDSAYNYVYENLSIEKMCNKYLDVYSKLLEQKR